MGDESCAEKYSYLFSPTLLYVFRENKLTIPHILDFLEDDDIVCDDLDCKHHVFSGCMEFGSSNTGEVIRTETEWVKQCHGCMCLLDLLPGSLTLQEIADAMGVSKEAIRKTESAALTRLYKRFKLGGDDEIVCRGNTTSGISTLLNK